MTHAASLDNLAATLGDLRSTVAAAADASMRTWAPLIVRPEFDASAHNLAAYLALRRRDLRPLQVELMALGLSSLGRLEGRVLANLDAVVWALDHLRGRPATAPVPRERFWQGQATLGRNTDTVFGPRSAPRRVRIIVTLPSEAADDPSLAPALLAAGADVFRINCAHDDRDAWSRMAANVRAAAARTGRDAKILMDLAGPKVRTGKVRRPADHDRLGIGDSFLLHQPDVSPASGFAAACQVPEVLDQLALGHRVYVDDGKLAAVVESVTLDGARLRITRVGPKGFKLKPEKGLNFPDTALAVAALSEKDLDDLPHVLAQADLIGFSFVQNAADIRALQVAMAAIRPADWQTLPLVAKIETPRAITELPSIIVAAAGRQPMAVMIARGDLAVEIGFERLAEMQEELMWLSEAAHVPVIWATQVLEQLVKKGLPSRGEMTDAAMAVRAEAVMLNKGPHVVEGVAALDRLLTRMADHQDKKTPKLRALGTWPAAAALP
jgi:pyruvate kinase